MTPVEPPLDPERWERLQALFHELADLPAEEQRARLAACAGTEAPELLAELARMLEEDARGDSLLHRDLGVLAGEMLDDGGGDAIPRTLGPYRLLHVLGEGGMGVVYLAERADLESRVAIKVLRDGWLSPARRERFAAEQRTLAKLNHPAIARLYDADILPGGTPWFAMEYVAGVPLTEHADAHAQSLVETLRLFRAVCEAVLHAHQHAIIHRDLKPSNILVTPGGQVKLLDFGIAKQLEGVGAADRTSTELRLMTPAYAAPEQLAGGELGVFTDLYSLGVILYELLAGQPPFDLSARTPAEAERIVRDREPARPSLAARERGRFPRVTRGAWADLDVLCLTAMQKDPARRYRSVDALIGDIDRFLRGEPLEARPTTWGYRAGKFLRRHWRATAAVAAALAVVISLVSFYTLRLTAARNAALADAERTRRIQEFMNSLFEGGDEDAGPSDTLRVLTLLGRGVAEARSLAAVPRVQAELYETLGGIYASLGDLERADSLQQAALAERRARLGTDHAEVARSLVALGLVRANESQLTEADSLVRSGLALFQRARGGDPADVARATTALGVVLEDRGDYAAAIATLAQAARLDSLAHLSPGDVSATLTELANCQFYAGHYAISDSLNLRTLAIDRALHGDHHPHVANDLINLGAIQFEQGHYPAAEARYREALAIYRHWYGDQHFETAATLTMVGRALIAQKEFDAAREPLTQALAIREHVYGPDHPNVAGTVNELAQLALQQGHLDEAEADFRRMLRIYETAYHGHHYLIGTACSNLASVYLERKDFREAERLYREALARYAATLAPDHLYVGIARIKLGRALLRQKRFAEAERESRAGYAIVAKQSDPGVSWLVKARLDLVEEYHALSEPDSAARFAAETARLEHSPKGGTTR